ncbi:MAG TPA: hypothetical protein VE981_14250 [Planctomycetota bacterium]|nr:hypothetical protein [Planctomycetota bacterium]
MLLFVACQEDVEIPRRDKQDYFEAVQACREAEAKVETDEAAAIEKLSAILANSKIVQIECRIRIQLQADKYTQPYLFVPYQLRGRAELGLAGKTANAAMRKQLLEDAVRDLKTSAAKGLDSSKKPLASAQAELEKLLAEAPAADPPVPQKNSLKIRAAWSQLVGERRYKSARTLLDKEADALTEKEKAELGAETQQACTSFLTEQMIRFRRNLASVSGIDELRRMSRDEFEISFALPAAEEIVVAYPPYDWARTQSDSLRAAWSNRDAIPALLRMAAQAARLNPDSENPWFTLAEGLAFQDLRRAMELRVADCADAPREKRDPLLGEARTLMDSWNGFVRGLDDATRKHHPFLDEQAKTLAGILAKAPRDLEGLETEDLRSCFAAAEVGVLLQKEEDRLRALEATGGLSRESRQNVLTLIVAARSIRMFLSGSAEEVVQKAVREDLLRLAKVGGAANADRFGPRLRKIFDSLR